MTRNHVPILQELGAPAVHLAADGTLLGMNKLLRDALPMDRPFKTLAELAERARRAGLRLMPDPLPLAAGGTIRCFCAAVNQGPESEQGFRELADAAPLMIWTSGPDKRVAWVNQAWLEFRGRTLEDEIGLGWTEGIHPEDYDSTLAGFYEAHVAFKPIELVYRLRHHDGDYRLIANLARPVFGRDGEFRGYIGTGMDVTEIARARSKALSLMQVIEDSINEVYVFNANTLRFIYCNKAACQNTQCTMEELREMTPLDLKKEFTEERFRSMVEPLQNGHQPLLRFITRHLRQDGTEYDVEVHLQYATFEGQRCFIAIILDVTERVAIQRQQRQLEAQLAKAQRNKSLQAMAAGVSHDFNNILMGIMGSLELLRDEVEPRGEAQHLIDRIEQGTTRAAALTRQMLAYSGAAQRLMRPLDLNSVVEEQLELLRDSSHDRVQLVKNLDGNLPCIVGDRSQLLQLLANLVTNSIEALEGRPQPKVSISTGFGTMMENEMVGFAPSRHAQAAEYVWLRVEDNGCGMSEETAQELFQPFFSTKFTGRGLGLAAVMGIVRSHLGMIKIITAAGEGTTAVVLLPLHPSRHKTSDIQSLRRPVTPPA